MAKKSKKPVDPVVEQLAQIKRLLVLGLIASGVRAKDVAIVLGVAKSAVSAMVPARAISRPKEEDNG